MGIHKSVSIYCLVLITWVARTELLSHLMLTIGLVARSTILQVDRQSGLSDSLSPEAAFACRVAVSTSHASQPPFQTPSNRYLLLVFCLAVRPLGYLNMSVRCRSVGRYLPPFSWLRCSACVEV